MPTNYSYDQLPALRETQDIAEYVDMAWSSERDAASDLGSTPRPPSNSYTFSNRRDTIDGSSLKSFSTEETLKTSSSEETSSSTRSGLRNLKDGWSKGLVSRVRRKPLPESTRGSIRKHPAAEIEPTRVSRGVWKDQLLVDRSLRSMSVLTTAFAIAMIVVIATNAKSFGARVNKFTSSVGGETQDCKTITQINTGVLFLVNVGATMVLGMSNTYQQIVTSLQAGDLEFMLRKFGDSRVGTNSPWNINHKKKGKVKAWAAWLLLVFTSLPIHFLANSLIGPSYIIEPPSNITWTEVPYKNVTQVEQPTVQGDRQIMNPGSFVCWSAFRTGKASFPHATFAMLPDLDYSQKNGLMYDEISITYSKDNCSGLAGTWDQDAASLEGSYHRSSGYGGVVYFQDGCENFDGVICRVSGQKPARCRLNVRMNAAFVLAAALSIKAIYMITMNFMARGHIKRQLLTFGDVLVASASHPELRVQGECMVNAKENYRRHSSHTCHKHCKSKKMSKTGEEIGHCQKCKKWNSVDHFTNEIQPTIATKIKRSLISNLGNTALTQMTIMTFCSIFMIAASITIAVPLASSAAAEKDLCEGGFSTPYCKMSSGERFSAISGGWGGFNHSLPIASLPPDSLGNEVLSFLISNGAQFIYSLLYLLLIYNLTLVSQEYDWGKLEHERSRLRCTTVVGDSFDQDYLLQLPKKILFPIMAYSVLTHWMLGEALQTQETIWQDIKPNENRHVEHSLYTITYAAYPVWIAAVLILAMTGGCWWAFGYRREGVIPQMFGSVRVLCAATTCLDDFPVAGVQWGDLGMGKQFRHAGLSSEEIGSIVPNELYAGMGDGNEASSEDTGMSEEDRPLLTAGNTG